MIPMEELWVSIGIFPRAERLLRLVACIEATAPSAQIIIVSLNQLGIQNVASKMAFIYVFQYMISILTITFWSTVIMAIVYK